MTSPTLDGTPLTAGPRVVVFRCPNGCGVVEWHEDGGAGFPIVKFAELSAEALAEWDARPWRSWPPNWKADKRQPLCPRCGAQPGEGEEHGVYTVEAVGGAGEKWRAGR